MVSQFEKIGPLLGCSTTLFFVEVIPLPPTGTTNDRNKAPALSAGFVKLHLQNMSLEASSKPLQERKGGLRVRWHPSKHGVREYCQIGHLFEDQRHPQADPPILHLPSEDPLQIHPIPCHVLACAWRPRLERHLPMSDVIVGQGTLVRVGPQRPSLEAMSNSALQLHIGESPCPRLGKTLETELLSNHSEETLQALTFRMSLLFEQQLSIGTTSDAFNLQGRLIKFSKRLSTSLQARSKPQGLPSPVPHAKSQNLPSILREGALLVHSPDHGAGKTLLVHLLAYKMLQCGSVHIIKPGALFAKYGVHADAALESTIHGIVMSAYARGNKPVCIVLDQLEGFLPPHLLGRPRVGTGDAADTTLNSMASYLKTLVTTLRTRQHVPFPSKNPLYNLGGSNGIVLPVRVGIIGVLTCPDDGWRSSQSASDSATGMQSTFLDAFVSNRFRLPTLSARTRLEAIKKAIDLAQVKLSLDATSQLPSLAASAVWLKGQHFRNVAMLLRQVMVSKEEKQVESTDIEKLLTSLRKGSMETQVTFLKGETTKGDSDVLGNVGGNQRAKKALKDALALDPIKRRHLAAFGLTSPIGVLLYGPPGCGKTLLAKGVAKLLGSHGASKSELGGAFLSLNSSGIVQAEIGTSEKMVREVFETARMNAPAVIFIDEFQALFTARETAGSGRLSSTLLQCMDDVKRWRDANGVVVTTESSSESARNTVIFVLGATNTPWMIDKAFLRPGRFDRLVHVGLPSFDDRKAILDVHIRRMKINPNERVFEICSMVASRTEGFSGADLSALCRLAAVRAVLESSVYVEARHFQEEMNQGLQPTSSSKLVERNSKWKP